MRRPGGRSPSDKEEEAWAVGAERAGGGQRQGQKRMGQHREGSQSLGRTLVLTLSRMRPLRGMEQRRDMV